VDPSAWRRTRDLQCFAGAIWSNPAGCPPTQLRASSPFQGSALSMPIIAGCFSYVWAPLDLLDEDWPCPLILGNNLEIASSRLHRLIPAADPTSLPHFAAKVLTSSTPIPLACLCTLAAVVSSLPPLFPAFFRSPDQNQASSQPRLQQRWPTKQCVGRTVPWSAGFDRLSRHLVRAAPIFVGASDHRQVAAIQRLIYGPLPFAEPEDPV